MKSYQTGGRWRQTYSRSRATWEGEAQVSELLDRPQTSDFGTAWRGELAAEKINELRTCRGQDFERRGPGRFLEHAGRVPLAVTADLRLMVRLHA